MNFAFNIFTVHCGSKHSFTHRHTHGDTQSFLMVTDASHHNQPFDWPSRSLSVCDALHVCVSVCVTDLLRRLTLTWERALLWKWHSPAECSMRSVVPPGPSKPTLSNHVSVTVCCYRRASLPTPAVSNFLNWKWIIYKISRHKWITKHLAGHFYRTGRVKPRNNMK